MSVREPRKDFLVFGNPLIEDPEIEEVVATLRSGWLGTGPKVKRFEQMMCEYTGARFACALNSCTAALHLSLLVAGVGPGDEVITSPMTFCATANAIIHTGATPVFVDINRETMNIDPAALERAVGPKTVAIIPVHMAGRPCEMDAIMNLAARHNLKVIEDAAHAIGATYHGRPIGNIGHFTCFSFYVTKNVVTAEGGMVTTNDEGHARQLEVLGLHGLSADAWTRYSDTGFRHYEVTIPGFKYNMTDLQASLGIHQLGRIEQYLQRREQIWRRYDEAFGDLPVTRPAGVDAGTRHARHLYTLLIDAERAGVTRDGVLRALTEAKIGAGIHFTSLHLHAYYAKRFDLKPDDLPNARYISDRTISLPLSAKLTDDDVEDVIAAVRKAVHR